MKQNAQKARTKTKNEFVPANVVFTKPLLKELDELAEAQAVNRSVIVREAVRQYVTLKKAA